MAGEPAIRGTRVTVTRIMGEYARGLTVAGIAAGGPRLPEANVLAMLAFAAEGLAGCITRTGD